MKMTRAEAITYVDTVRNKIVSLHNKADVLAKLLRNGGTPLQAAGLDADIHDMLEELHGATGRINSDMAGAFGRALRTSPNKGDVRKVAAIDFALVSDAREEV